MTGIAARPWRLVSALVALQLVNVVLEARVRNDGAFAVLVALLFAPVTVLAAYRIRGLWGAAAWVLLPVLAVSFLTAAYRHTYTHEVLPYFYGLAGQGRFLAMVGLLLLAATVPPAALVLGVLAPIVLGHHSVDWGQLHGSQLSLREDTWSVELLEFLAVAGLIGAARRSRLRAATLGAWFLAFLLFEGSHHAVATGGFFRAQVPALPAYLLLAASIPLLVPRLQERDPLRENR